MSTVVMSGKYPAFVNAVRALDNNVITTDDIKIFPEPEQQHTDMQLLKIKNDIFILKECEKLKSELNGNVHICQNYAGSKYPDNILLNFLYLNNKLYGKIKYLDKNVYSYCVKNGIEMINVNQGYARCSTLVINDKAVITSDVSIKKALEKNGVEVLLISPGNVKLEGYNYGFIGGASGRLEYNTVVFFGDITIHPDYDRMNSFIRNHNSKIEILCKNLSLTDIGGIVEF